jgi:hypothetical protein
VFAVAYSLIAVLSGVVALTILAPHSSLAAVALAPFAASGLALITAVALVVSRQPPERRHVPDGVVWA